jgi:hypothetical protein
MAPFAGHLGIGVDEFKALCPIFVAGNSRVLLVEKDMDVKYFNALRTICLQCEKLNLEIEVVPYECKYTINNTVLCQFVLRKFDKLFLTYDVDAYNKVRSALARLSLDDRIDFATIGVKEPGKDCMEGILPQKVIAAVTGRETDLGMKLGGQDNRERRKAKDERKKKYFE